MKVELLDKDLPQLATTLQEEIKKLDKLVKYGIVENEKRS